MPARTKARAPEWRNRIVGYEAAVDPAQLRANPKNWRLHPKAQRDALRGTLSEVGWVDTVLVNTTTGHVVDGHARLEEALASGSTVPVIYAELTEAEEALVLATLDPITAMADTDQTKLGALVAEISVDDAGLRHLLGDLAGPEERRGGLTDPDDAPGLPAETYVRSGELWQLGDHRLLIGDATSAADVARVTGGELVDLLWTDPPYGVAYQASLSTADPAKVHMRHRRKDALIVPNDDLGDEGTRRLIAAALELVPLAPGAPFYIAGPSGPMGLAFLLAIHDAGMRHAQTLAWVKDRLVLGRSDFHYRHETVIVGELEPEPLVGKELDDLAYGWKPGAKHFFHGGRQLDSVWEIKRPARSVDHPTMKPVELVARALEYSSLPGDRVMDPFSGSGTTLIACEQLGRQAIALELDPRYGQVIIERWQAFTGRKAERIDG